MKPIRVFFGFIILLFWVLMVPQIPKYWANDLLIGLITLFILWVWAVCLLQD